MSRSLLRLDRNRHRSWSCGHVLDAPRSEAVVTRDPGLPLKGSRTPDGGWDELARRDRLFGLRAAGRASSGRTSCCGDGASQPVADRRASHHDRRRFCRRPRHVGGVGAPADVHRRGRGGQPGSHRRVGHGGHGPGPRHRRTGAARQRRARPSGVPGRPGDALPSATSLDVPAWVIRSQRSRVCRWPRSPRMPRSWMR